MVLYIFKFQLLETLSSLLAFIVEIHHFILRNFSPSLFSLFCYDHDWPGACVDGAPFTHNGLDGAGDSLRPSLKFVYTVLEHLESL
jgi:hypothetical protein